MGPSLVTAGNRPRCATIRTSTPDALSDAVKSITTTARVSFDGRPASGAVVFVGTERDDSSTPSGLLLGSRVTASTVGVRREGELRDYSRLAR